MTEPELTRMVSKGVALLGDVRHPGGVTLAFTERTGGVSQGPWSSLNLGDACGDDPAAVERNRQLACDAIGALGDFERLVNPRQVHGDRVVVVADASDVAVSQVQREVRAGADAVVCAVPGVPVLLCYADCVPVVLVAPGAFAVVHSGWRGTIAGIAGKALGVLTSVAGCEPTDVLAYIGPRIAGEDYEVSSELMDRFEGRFGDVVRAGERHLDLAAAIRRTLEGHGMADEAILDCGLSTARETGRFFSYRVAQREGDGRCGRHGALAYLPRDGSQVR